MTASPILFVNADPEVAGRWRSVLEKSLIEVCVVATVGEGLREFRMTRFGAVILAEELLPTPQGQILAEHCFDGLEPISLIIVTNRYDSANSVELRGRGVFEYIDQDVSEDDVARLANRLDIFLSELETPKPERTHLRLRERVQYLGLHLNQIGDLDSLSRAIVDGFVDICGADAAILWADIHGRGELRFIASAGVEGVEWRIPILRLGEATGEHTLRSGNAHSRETDDEGNRLTVQWPLMHRGEVVGVLKALGVPARNQDEELELAMRHLVDAAALALTSLQAEEERGSSFLHSYNCYSRAYFEDCFHRELQRARRYRRPLTLLLVSYANSSGSEEHLLPDEVREMSEHASAVMAQAVRGIDVVAQLSANTYAVMLPESPYLAGLIVGQRIRQGLEQEPAVSSICDKHRVTYCFGLAALPGDGNEVSALMTTAMRRMREHQRTSFANPMVRRLGFWDAAEMLIEPPVMSEEEFGPVGNRKELAAPACTWRPITPDGIAAVRDMVLREAMAQSAGLGWLYLAGRVSADLSRLQHFEGQFEDGQLKVYTLNEELFRPWLELENLTQLVGSPEDLEDHEVVLFFSKHCAYGMVAKRQQGDRWLGYHTSDWVTVSELMDKLQLTYRLQKAV